MRTSTWLPLLAFFFACTAPSPPGGVEEEPTRGTVASADGPWGVDFAYIVKGNMTTRFRELREGDRLEVWGPLGNGFPLATAPHLVMVAGGIGYTPFMAVAKANEAVRWENSRARSKNSEPRSRSAKSTIH